MNSHDAKKIIFRVDGGRESDTGTGHIIRSLMLAEQLGKRVLVFFISKNLAEYSYGHSLIRERGFNLLLVDSQEYLNALEFEIKKIRPSFVVCDLYHYLLDELRLYKRFSIPTMTFDTCGEYAELSKYPINAVKNGSGSYEGPKYMVLPTIARHIEFEAQVKQIFVCFGGYDHNNITKKIFDLLCAVSSEIKIVVVVSKLYDLQKNIFSVYGSLPANIEIKVNPQDFHELLRGSQIAVVSGGLLLYECLSLGIATIAIHQYGHQNKTAREFSDANAFFNLGMGEWVNLKKAEKVLKGLLCRPDLRKKLFFNARRLVDGKGCERVVSLIYGEIGSD